MLNDTIAYFVCLIVFAGFVYAWIGKFKIEYDPELRRLAEDIANAPDAERAEALIDGLQEAERILGITANVSEADPISIPVSITSDYENALLVRMLEPGDPGYETAQPVRMLNDAEDSEDPEASVVWDVVEIDNPFSSRRRGSVSPAEAWSS